jgi:hypothetical protein
MPKIRWNDLPPALRDHLFDRLRERKISAEDVYRLNLAGQPAKGQKL